MSTQVPSTGHTSNTEKGSPSSLMNDDDSSATTEARTRACPTAYETADALFKAVNILKKGHLPPQHQIPCYRMIWQCLRLTDVIPESVPDPDEDLKSWEMKCWRGEDISDWEDAKAHGPLYDMYKKAAQGIERTGRPAWQG
jgi:hypothetical protein